MRLAAALTTSILFAMPAPSPAWTCGRVWLSPFELADRAAEVAIVRGEGDSVSVEEVLRGTGTVWQRLPEGERPEPAPLPSTSAPTPASPPPSPPAPRRRGRGPRIIRIEVSCRTDSILEDIGGRVLAFATAEGWSVHPAGTSTVALPPESSLDAAAADALLSAVRRWLATPAPAARRRLLLDLARRPDRVGWFAAMHFGAAPALLHRLPRREAVELVVAIERHLARLGDLAESQPLLTTLERLHLPEAIPVLIDLLSRPQWQDWDGREAVRNSLGGLANRAPGGDADWLAWWAGVDTASRDRLIQDGFRERGVVVDASSAASLSQVIRAGPTDLDRLRALDLCEQETGRTIALDEAATWNWPGFGSAFLDGATNRSPAVWEELARRCSP